MLRRRQKPRLLPPETKLLSEKGPPVSRSPQGVGRQAAFSNELVSSDRHLTNEDRARPDRAAHVHITADRNDIEIHLAQVSGDCDLMHRVRDGAILHPEAARAARIVAR